MAADKPPQQKQQPKVSASAGAGKNATSKVNNPKKPPTNAPENRSKPTDNTKKVKPDASGENLQEFISGEAGIPNAGSRAGNGAQLGGAASGGGDDGEWQVVGKKGAAAARPESINVSSKVKESSKAKPNAEKPAEKPTKSAPKLTLKPAVKTAVGASEAAASKSTPKPAVRVAVKTAVGTSEAAPKSRPGGSVPKQNAPDSRLGGSAGGFNAAGGSSSSVSNASKLRGLKKKLRDIKDLEDQVKAGGAKLNPDQEDKLKKKKQLQAEMKQLEQQKTGA